MSAPTNERLDLEFAYTSWEASCRDPSPTMHECRRPHQHDGPHAAGFGDTRQLWANTGEENPTMNDHADQPRVMEPRNGLGIAALSLGVVGLLFGIVPITGFIAFALGAVGVILGLSARGRLKRGTATNRKTTWAGVIVSVLAIVLGIVGMINVFNALDELDRDLEEIERDLDS